MKFARRLVSFALLIIGAFILLQVPLSHESQKYELDMHEIVAGIMVVFSFILRFDDYKSWLGLLFSVLSVLFSLMYSMYKFWLE